MINTLNVSLTVPAKLPVTAHEKFRQRKILSMENFASENLVLIEFLVEHVHFEYNVANDMEDLKGETCVSFQFLDNAPIGICEDDYKPKTQNNVKRGKSCLFSITAEQGEEMLKQFNVYVEVYRLTNAEPPEKICIGNALVKISELFKELMEDVTDGKVTEAKELKDCYKLLSQTGELVGNVSVFIRLSCYGKLIMTQFQMNLDDKTVEFKAKDAHFLFRSKKNIKCSSRCSPDCQEVGQDQPCPPPCPIGSDDSMGDGEKLRCMQPPPCCPHRGKVGNEVTVNNVDVCGDDVRVCPIGYAGAAYAQQQLLEPQVPCYERYQAQPITCPAQPTSYQPQSASYPQPPASYQSPPCYQQPTSYQQAATGYQQAATGYRQAATGYQYAQPCPQPPRMQSTTFKQNEYCLSSTPYDDFAAMMGDAGGVNLKIFDDPTMCPYQQNCPPQLPDNTCPVCHVQHPQPNAFTQQALTMGPREPFTFKMGGCCPASNNITVTPPTCTAKDGTKYTEISDPNKEIFVLRVGKKCERAGKSQNVDLELITPRPLDINEPLKEHRRCQYTVSDFPIGYLQEYYGGNPPGGATQPAASEKPPGKGKDKKGKGKGQKKKK